MYIAGPYLRYLHVWLHEEYAHNKYFLPIDYLWPRILEVRMLLVQSVLRSLICTHTLALFLSLSSAIKLILTLSLYFHSLPLSLTPMPWPFLCQSFRWETATTPSQPPRPCGPLSKSWSKVSMTWCHGKQHPCIQLESNQQLTNTFYGRSPPNSQKTGT